MCSLWKLNRCCHYGQLCLLVIATFSLVCRWPCHLLNDGLSTRPPHKQTTDRKQWFTVVPSLILMLLPKSLGSLSVTIIGINMNEGFCSTSKQRLWYVHYIKLKDVINAATEHCRGKLLSAVCRSTNLFNIEPDRGECYVVDYDVYLTEHSNICQCYPTELNWRR